MLARTLRVTVFLLLAAAAGASAQQPDSAEDARRPRIGPHPIELLLEHRDTLGLTTEQIERMDAVRERLERRTRPMIDRMVELRREWREQRIGEARRRIRVRPPPMRRRMRGVLGTASVLERRIRTMNARAMREVGEILDVEQRRLIRGLMLRDRSGRGRGVPPRERRPPPRDEGR